jgi:hypothetical protein
VNTAVTIVDTITRTVVELAFIGAGLKLALTIAPGLRLTAAPKASQPKRDAEAKADDAEAKTPALVPGLENVA